MQPLRDYQQRAVVGVFNAWQTGHRSVCLVLPTGGGKTRIAEEFCWREKQHEGKTVFIVHRRELLKQTADRLRASLGHFAVGLIAPKEEYQPQASVQVATVQTLLARNIRPDASLIIFDECHHYVSSDWIQLSHHYAQARALGLTATPERQDGKALGDIFTELIVGAHYSELLEHGNLVQCRAFQPPDTMGADLALDPLAAYQKYAEGSQAFLFAGSVKLAQMCTDSFNAAGVSTATVHAKMKKSDRDDALRLFSAGKLRCLANYNVLTEGVDVPAARTVILARGFEHVSTFLQAAGRVLRPHPDKSDAIIIDLTGATLRHGLPTEDRIYSLEGKGIQRTNVTPLRNCLQCGATLAAALMGCPECGYRFKKQDPRIPKIYSLELREVFAGQSTPEDAKRREYERLRKLQKERGWSLYYVQKQYKQLFKEDMVIRDATDDEMRTEYARLKEVQKQRGLKPGFVFVMFKKTFGRAPPPSITVSMPGTSQHRDLPFNT